MKNSLIVSYTPGQQARAEDYAQRHDLPCMPIELINSGLSLQFRDECVALRDIDKNTEIHVDFIAGALAHRKRFGGGRGQAIAKAIGLKQGTQPPRVLDATAGLAKDAFVLACLGCPITLVERSPHVAALVDDAIQRASDDEDFQAIVNTGFTLIQSSSIDYMKQLNDEDKPEVIYLDPMYPERKKSAQVKKNMQMLQSLLGKDEDTDILLTTALANAGKRVVVKRPKGAEEIAGPKPDTVIESKKTRYDVYVIKKDVNKMKVDIG